MSEESKYWVKWYERYKEGEVFYSTRHEDFHDLREAEEFYENIKKRNKTFCIKCVYLFKILRYKK